MYVFGGVLVIIGTKSQEIVYVCACVCTCVRVLVRVLRACYRTARVSHSTCEADMLLLKPTPPIREFLREQTTKVRTD